MCNRLLGTELIKEDVRWIAGFRTNLRTTRAMYQLNNDIVSGVNDTLYVLGIFCDLAKVSLC